MMFQRCLNRFGDRAAAVFIAVSCLIFFSCRLGETPALPAGRIVVRANPVELDAKTSGRRDFGQLTFLSGFELTSKDSRFGGLSGLALSADGDSLYAVSDHGYWLTVRMLHDETGWLAGFGPWQISPLLTPEAMPVSGQQRDAEALARDEDGFFIVSFERDHRLWRYPPPPEAFHSQAEPLPVPDDLSNAPSNGGLEGITVLSDGRLLLLTERYENPDGTLKGWIVEDGQFAVVSYVTSDGFVPTDAEALANGDVLVLERRYRLLTGAAARIRRIAGVNLRPGSQLQGEEIVRLKPPLLVDNFEGIAVREDPRLGTLVYLISDDNYNPLQRTLLFQFRLNATSGN